MTYGLLEDFFGTWKSTLFGSVYTVGWWDDPPVRRMDGRLGTDSPQGG